MGSNQWNAATPQSAQLEIGNFYQHPDDGVIRITGGQYMGSRGVSNHWNWEVMATGERNHGYGCRYWDLVDPETHRDYLIRRLEDHGVAVAAAVGADRMSHMLITLDRMKSYDQFLIDQEQARQERLLRQQRYNAPLNQPLPAAQ